MDNLLAALNQGLAMYELCQVFQVQLAYCSMIIITTSCIYGYRHLSVNLASNMFKLTSCSMCGSRRITRRDDPLDTNRKVDRSTSISDICTIIYSKMDVKWPTDI